jgi:hypothetical protein
MHLFGTVEDLTEAKVDHLDLAAREGRVVLVCCTVVLEQKVLWLDVPSQRASERARERERERERKVSKGREGGCERGNRAPSLSAPLHVRVPACRCVWVWLWRRKRVHACEVGGVGGGQVGVCGWV